MKVPQRSLFFIHAWTLDIYVTRFLFVHTISQNDSQRGKRVPGEGGLSIHYEDKEVRWNFPPLLEAVCIDVIALHCIA